MEEYNYAYCPNPNCFNKLGADWSCYQVNKNKDNIPIYKCPYCGIEFSSDQLPVTAVNVTGYNLKDRFIVIKENKLIGEFSTNYIFKVGNNHYLHIPTKMLKNAKVYSIPQNMKLEDVDFQAKNGKVFKVREC